jgi:serine/threonine-protein phosphatase 4 regulatory subunit 4
VTFGIYQIVKDDLLQLALTKGDVEETTTSRMICSRVLGAIAPVLEPQEIEKSFLSKAMALCQVIM